MPGANEALADADLIRQTAKEVLQRPDYELESVEDLGRFFAWLWDLLKPVFELLDALYDWSPVWFFIGVVLLVVLLFVIVAHIVYSLRTTMRRRRAPGAYDIIDDPSETVPETWEKRAQEAYEVQDYLPAVRYLLHAGLLRLEQARQGKLRRGATNREYLRRYRNTEAYDPLALMVEITDSRWFGGIDCTRQDVEQCMEALSQLQEISRGNANAVNA